MFCFSDIDWLNGALLSDLQPQLPPEGVGIAGKGPFTAHLSLQPFIPHLFIRRFLHHLSPIHTTTTPWCSETKYIKNLKKKWFSKKKNAHLSQLDTRKEKILCPSCFSRPTTWSLFLSIVILISLLINDNWSSIFHNPDHREICYSLNVQVLTAHPASMIQF